MIPTGVVVYLLELLIISNSPCTDEKLLLMWKSKYMEFLDEFLKKSIRIMYKSGIRSLLKKIAVRFRREVLGKNFYDFVFYTSYKRLWAKVSESYGVKSILVFWIRFILVLLFGWIIVFIPKRPYISATPKQVRSWFRKNHKKVTVVIPTYNDYKLTKTCVESIKRLSSGEFVDIVIVDDGSSKKIQDKLKKLDLPAKIILKNKNEGFAKTCNAGMSKVKFGDIVLLNNDATVHDGWIEGLQYYAYLNKEIGITGPKLIYPDRTIQWAGSHRNTGAPQWFDHNFRFKDLDYGPANVPVEVLSATGACMYIKRSVVNKIGLFDPKFGMAFEDVDYSIRAWNAGFKIFYAPISVVTHYESKTRGKKQGPRETQALRYFWKKWKKWFDERKVTNRKGQTKIIYVMKDTGVAGGHKVIFEHLNGLVKKGYDVSLYATAPPPDWFPLKSKVRSFRTTNSLETDLKSQDAIKVATWWETAPIVWRSSVTRGVPVYFVQDIESSYYNGNDPFKQKVLSWYKKEFNYITTSTWNKDHLGDFGLTSKIIAPALDQSIFKLKNLERETNTLLSVGRTHRLKNLSFTLKGWRVLNKKPKLVLFGVEPSLGRRVGAKYVFSPEDSEVADLYNRATIFIQTSHHEGFCLTVLEAMACGVPVICTNADGNMDFCVDGKNCIIVEQNNVDELASAMRELLKNNKLRESLVKSGLKTAAKYSWSSKINDLDKYFSNLAKKP